MGTERRVSNQHALEYDDRGTLGVRQDGVHDQIIGGQSRSVRDTSENLLLLRSVARRISSLEKTRGQVSRRHPRFGTVTRVVSPRWITGVGRSDGRRGQRQTGLGSLHQTFASSERDGGLLVSRHVSTRHVSHNAHYIVAFKNPRDQLGMRNLLLQAFPTQWQHVQDTFRRVTDRPFGYLFLDLHPKSTDDRRILSQLLKEEGFVRCHQLKREVDSVSGSPRK